MLTVKSSSCLISRGSICGPRGSIWSSLLFGKLKPNIRAGTESHQPEQRRTKLGHGQVVVNRREKNDSQHDRPRKNLEAMTTVATGVGEHVSQKTPRAC